MALGVAWLRDGDGDHRPWTVHGPIDDGPDLAGCVYHPGSIAELVFRDFMDRAVDADDECGVHGFHPVHDPGPGNNTGQAPRQALFAIGIAAVYGMLLVSHVVYGLLIAP